MNLEQSWTHTELTPADIKKYQERKADSGASLLKERDLLRDALVWLIGRCPTDVTAAPFELQLTLAAARNAAAALRTQPDGGVAP